MSYVNDDDFWNTSSSSGFNFDDDEEEDPQLLFVPEKEENNIIPIQSVISKTGLDYLLEDIKSTHEYVVPPVEETIKKMIHGQKHVLHIYQILNDKLLLLDSALETCDGNIIINVILFLKQTLKQNIFFHQLSKRKVAVKHYANYLIISNSLQELADLYMATGNISNMKQLYYLIGRETISKESLYKRLEHFMIEHLQKSNSHEEKLEINENMQLMQWQIDRKEGCESVIEQLAALCKKEWLNNKNSNETVIDFKKRFKIDDFAYEWTILNTMASMEMWQQLSNFFIKPNWLTKKIVLKSVINSELFVYGLSLHEPPKDVLEQYLNCISDSDRSLELALKLKCHNFVIQSYINQKDRLAILNYKTKVTPQSEEYFLIENALISTKWKN